MKKSLFFIMLAGICVPAAFSQQTQPIQAKSELHTASPTSPLTNRDIISMVKGGLTSDVIIAKIETSPCDFDTSPGTLTELKAAGVADAVILAMVKRSAQPQTEHRAGASGAMQPSAKDKPNTELGGLGAYEISYMKSSRRLGDPDYWKPNTYSEISELIQNALVKSLLADGLERVKTLDSACCRITINLVQVDTSHGVWTWSKGKAGMSAQLTVTDVNGNLRYSKVYETTERAHKEGHWPPRGMMQDICNHLVAEIASDQAFVNSLKGSEL